MSNYNYGQRGGPGGAPGGSAEDPTANGSAATSSRGRYGFGTGGAFQPIAGDAPAPSPRVPTGNPSTGSMADSLLLEMVEKAIETKLAKIDRCKFKLLKNTLLPCRHQRKLFTCSKLWELDRKNDAILAASAKHDDMHNQILHVFNSR